MISYCVNVKNKIFLLFEIDKCYKYICYCYLEFFPTVFVLQVLHRVPTVQIRHERSCPTKLLFVVIQMLCSGEKYICDDCGSTFESNAQLFTHQKMEKAKAIAKENGAKYKCGLCGNKEFILESSYKQHVKRKHASDKPTCSECGKQFVSTTSLERHMKLHASLGCEQCR